MIHVDWVINMGVVWSVRRTRREFRITFEHRKRFWRGSSGNITALDVTITPGNTRWSSCIPAPFNTCGTTNPGAVLWCCKQVAWENIVFPWLVRSLGALTWEVFAPRISIIYIRFRSFVRILFGPIQLLLVAQQGLNLFYISWSGTRDKSNPFIFSPERQNRLHFRSPIPKDLLSPQQSSAQMRRSCAGDSRRFESRVLILQSEYIG